MPKVTFSLLFLMFCATCQLNSEMPQIGTRFEKTVGSKIAHIISNAQVVVATDISAGSRFILTSQQVESFQKFVLSDSSYIFDYKKRCPFIPQIACEISGSPEVKLFISIICNQIRFDSPGKSIVIDYDLVKKEFNKLNKSMIRKIYVD